LAAAAKVAEEKEVDEIATAIEKAAASETAAASEKAATEITAAEMEADQKAAAEKIAPEKADAEKVAAEVAAPAVDEQAGDEVARLDANAPDGAPDFDDADEGKPECWEQLASIQRDRHGCPRDW
jgi:hypothetical protein